MNPPQLPFPTPSRTHRSPGPPLSGWRAIFPVPVLPDDSLPGGTTGAGSTSGAPVGVLAYNEILEQCCLYMWLFEIRAGVSWSDVFDAVVKYMAPRTTRYARKMKKKRVRLTFNLGPTHPVYDVRPDLFEPAKQPYAWYIRVPNVACLIRRFSGVIEKRLETSVFNKYTDNLLFSFFEKGL